MNLPLFFCRPITVLSAAALLLACPALGQAQPAARPQASGPTTNDASAAPVFYPVEDQTGRVGFSFTYQTAAQNSPSSYGAAGLPPGVAIDTASGLISGVPTAAGTFPVTVSATNADGVGTATLNLVIAPPLPNVTVTADVSKGYPAQGINASFTITRDGDLSEDLHVAYILKGSAKNGVDYETLTITKKIKAGKASKRIQVRALDESGQGVAQKSVKLLLEPGESYRLGAVTTAKAKVIYTP